MVAGHLLVTPACPLSRITADGPGSVKEARGEDLTCSVKEFRLHGQKASTCFECQACKSCWASRACYSIENKTLLLSENVRTNAGE